MDKRIIIVLTLIIMITTTACSKKDVSGQVAEVSSTDVAGCSVTCEDGSSCKCYSANTNIASCTCLLYPKDGQDKAYCVCGAGEN